MDLHNIKGPQDYHKFHHISSEGLVWLDGRETLPFHTHWVIMLRPFTRLICGIQSNPETKPTNITSQSMDMDLPIASPLTLTHPDDHPHQPHNGRSCRNEPSMRLQHGDSKGIIGVLSNTTWHDAICTKCHYIPFLPPRQHSLVGVMAQKSHIGCQLLLPQPAMTCLTSRELNT